MRTFIATLMGPFLGFFIFMMAAMLFVKDGEPSSLFVFVTFFGGWILSSYLISRWGKISSGQAKDKGGMIINWEKEIRHLKNNVNIQQEDGLDIIFRGDDNFDEESIRASYKYKVSKNSRIWIWIGKERIVFSNDQVMAIAEAGIAVSDNEDITFIRWEDLEAVSEEATDGNFLITVTHHSDDVIIISHEDHIHTEIVEFINKIASCRGKKNILVDELVNKLNNNKYEKKDIDELISLVPHPNNYHIRGCDSFKEGKYKEACHDFEKVNELIFSGEYEEFPKIAETNYMLALAYDQIDEFLSARTAMQRALTHCLDSELKVEMEEKLSDINNSFSKKFLDIHYSKRRNIMIVDKLPDNPSKNVYFLTNDDCHGEGWKWEPGHPHEKIIYVGHPLIAGVYISIKDFHNYLIKDKYSELMYLLQALGAETISIKVAKGESIAKEIITDRSGSIGGEKIAGFTLSGGKRSKKASAGTKTQSHSLMFNFTPVNKPYLPDDLHWFQHEPLWKRIADSRLKGGIIDAMVELRYDDDYSINEDTTKKISAEVKAFKIGVSASYFSDVQKSLSKKESILWEFKVRFAPVLPSNNKLPIIQSS